MRKRIGFILYYFCMLLGGAVLSVFVYLQYLGCTNLVAGYPFKITKELFLFAFFQATPVVIIFIPLILMIYKIRHLTNPVWSAVVFSVCCAFSWIVLFPLVEKGREVVFSELDMAAVCDAEPRISGGYFRKIFSGVYYFLDDSQDDKSDVLLVHDYENPGLFGGKEKINISSGSEFDRASFPFRDPCIKETLADMPYEIMNVISVVKNNAASEWSKGLVAWLCFCSLGVALSSAYSYVRISSWRMINWLFIIIIDTAVLFFNSLYYSEAFSSFRLFCNQLLFGKESMRFAFFYNRKIDLPVCIINMFVAAVIITAGCAVTAIRNGRKVNRH